MANSRDFEWESNKEDYSPNQVEAVVNYCGVEVVKETPTHFVGYCPFHNNTDSPAFAVDMYNGKWTCFNPTCLESGKLEQLLTRVKKTSRLQALIFIEKHKNAKAYSLEEKVSEALAKPVDLKEFPQEALDRLVNDFWEDANAIDYMHYRGFNDATLKYFEIGFNAAHKHRDYDIVTVPMHDIKGRFIGTIGRIPDREKKIFHNSYQLPKTKSIWNIHRAKKFGETVIVCESSFDAMRIHQAGYPNVVATLGGHVSVHHIEQLGRTFSKIIIMTDFDKPIYFPDCKPCGYKRCIGHRPGRDLGRQLVAKLPTKKFLWAAYDDSCIYPRGLKDASDMTDDEIRKCLRNAVSDFTYQMWDIENAVPVAVSN